MESVKKWLAERQKKNGIYIHSNPPKLFGAVSSIELRHWARTGAEGKLERAILAGQGRRLLAEAEALPLSKHLYNLILKCDALQNAVEKGSLLELKEALDRDYNRNKHVACCDDAGVGLLHKAIYYNYLDIAEYLVTNYPQLVHQRDSEGRTPLHYTAACREEAAAAGLLQRAGAGRGARDAAGHTLAYYRADRTRLLLPVRDNMPTQPPGLVVKRHNIRIWCHECDMGRLQRVVWEGQGARLLSEVSSQPVVKRFLEAVPYIMNTIRDIHEAVVQNNLESVIKLTSDPVPPLILSSKDANNMTAMHKAAGLGHNGILKYIIERYPQGIQDIDNEGRTPLHYAAGVRDDQHTYNTLVSSGADESVVDNKNKTPAYYVNKSTDIDKNNFKTLPEAPRTPSSAYPPSWDWKILDVDFIGDFNKKYRKKNLKASNENISSKTNTNTISENTESQISGMKSSSTHEIISNLPDLDDNENPNPINGNETQENENDNKNENENENDKVNEEDENEEIIQSNNVTENGKDTDDVHEENNDIDVGNDETLENEQNDNESKDDNEPENNNLNEITNVESNENDIPISSPEHNNADQNHDREEVNSDNDEQENVEEEKPEEVLNDEVDANVNQVESETNDDNDGKLDTPENIDENLQNIENETADETADETVEETADETVDEIADKTSDHVEDDPENITETKQNINDETNDQTNAEDDIVNDKDNEDNEEESNDLLDEGNKSNDHNEDDDDVQVPGSPHSEHNTSPITSALSRETNGSAKRGEINASSGNLTNERNIQDNLIEGIISSEAEQETLDASILLKNGSITEDILIVDNEIDPEVTDLINTANMEMLATLVLNGEGSRLIGRYSGNQELQAFLNNVPTYMQKINRVHIAARDGNLKDLQAALDRRKFAIARDSISPNGATPLHVATIFGKTNILKYLGGRFPETLSAVDFEGRTALHYAAVLPDNGHYYNLLQQLGANSKDLDDIGQSADNYYRNPTLLPINQLLADFGVSENMAKKIFSDKGNGRPPNGHTDTPMFHTEEGRYLAKSLGDPLIKGLTEVANVKPKDPIAFLATFLHNFPDHEKPRLGTQESKTFLTKGGPEIENDNPPPETEQTKMMFEESAMQRRVRSASRTATVPHRPIEVVTVEPNASSPDAPEAAYSSANRDEHGQSMLHFAAARAHSNNALLQILQESDVSLGYRDELYRTARDISIQANVLDNTAQIDKYVLQLAARGNTDKIMELLLLGYDHILDVVDEQGVNIKEVIAQRGDNEMSNLLASIPTFEESREAVHGAVRSGDLNRVKDLVSGEGGGTLVRAHNLLGRTVLHTAVLAQDEDIVAYLAENFPELLRIGDNLERTPLHYAMGVDKMESLSHILIKAGAKRVLKDLKGRQPSYYFMNKSEILRLKEEEEAY